MSDSLHKLNIGKLREGCSQDLFGTTDLSDCSLPRDIDIDESQCIHFVQILFILKERCWEANEWTPFTKRNLKRWIYADKNIYLENTPTFGKEFFDGFTKSVNTFIEAYCDKAFS